MRFEYSLDEDDYLTCELYQASYSENIKTARLHTRWVWVTCSLTLGLWASEEAINSMAVFFFILSGLSLVAYPLYSRWVYRTNYLNYIREHRKNQLGVSVVLEFTNEGLKMSDNTGEGKIVKTELKAFVELPEHILLKLRSGVLVVIPKRKIDLSALESVLKSLSENWGVPILRKTNWKWR